ncbi:cell wall hydrolase [Pelagibius sp. Alg239-R121]|uniref:cell wall hydrolase n=1 Tax=Pelagibius sp. Alg239-R121 TaxID=2993448 RepID=UPI0024A67091|nr:cell wall hydrolase [Pelagibius sp. Alg239-R121]
MINVLAKKTDLLGRIQRTPWVAISASFLAGAVFMGAAASDRAPAVMAFEAPNASANASAPSSASQPPETEKLLHLASDGTAAGAIAGAAEVTEAIESFKKTGAEELQLPKVTDIGRGVNLAVVKASRAPTQAKVEDELFCMAQNIYFEARSEPTAGRRAVAHVVMNRVASSRFPSTVCEVVRQGGENRRYKCQFSWWCDGLSDDIKNAKSWRDAERLAAFVYWGLSIDMTGGALFYHADYVKPRWRNAFNKGPQIGRHIFYSYKKPTKKVKGTQLASRVSED